MQKYTKFLFIFYNCKTEDPKSEINLILRVDPMENDHYRDCFRHRQVVYDRSDGEKHLASTLRGWTSGEQGRESIAPHTTMEAGVGGHSKGSGKHGASAECHFTPGHHVLVRVGFRILPFFSRKRSFPPERLTTLSYSYFTGDRNVLPSPWISPTSFALQHSTAKQMKYLFFFFLIMKLEWEKTRILTFVSRFLSMIFLFFLDDLSTI